jgi:phage baseplate assembly protein W
MAIKIKNLEQAAKTFTQQQYLYKDLTLDLSISQIKTTEFRNTIASSDIKASYDLEAIRNSLLNLFNTYPGQRFLFPEYGLKLEQFLFEPITVETGTLIGDAINDGIRKYEPRVVVRQVEVIGDPDSNQYNITLNIEIPTFNTFESLNFALNTENKSFIVLQ